MFDQCSECEVPSLFIVDQDCIDKGVKKDPDGCMLVHAILKAGGKNPFVPGKAVFFTYNGVNYKAEIDERTQGKVRLFDSGEWISPFVFSAEPKVHVV